MVESTCIRPHDTKKGQSSRVSALGLAALVQEKNVEKLQYGDDCPEIPPSMHIHCYATRTISATTQVVTSKEMGHEEHPWRPRNVRTWQSLTRKTLEGRQSLRLTLSQLHGNLFNEVVT